MALPFSRTLGAGTHQLTVSDINILCDTSFGVVNLRLPKISNIVSFGASQGYGIGSLSLFTLNITDISTNASANNINILPTSGNFFSNNLPNLKIDTNNGSVVLKPASELLWNVNVSSTGSSTPIIALGSGSGSSYRIGNNNSVSSNYGTVSGGYFNIDNGACASTIGGGGCNSISGYRMNTISGGYSNTASGYYQATIGGGYANTSSNCYTTVAGGATNISSGRGSTIGGGYSNDSTNDYSTISGGYNNTASGNCSTISGGYNNAATGGSSTVSGGYNNSTSGYASTISGGYNNSTSAAYTGILGGKNNQTNFSDSMIVGSDIIADRSCTTFVNNLSIMNIPVSSVGLPAGSVWNNGGVLNIV